MWPHILYSLRYTYCRKQPDHYRATRICYYVYRNTCYVMCNGHRYRAHLPVGIQPELQWSVDRDSGGNFILFNRDTSCHHSFSLQDHSRKLFFNRIGLRTGNGEFTCRGNHAPCTGSNL